ncbi:MAG: hypothetical protein ACREAM_01775 [Blastocatellia bacterium]
MKYGIWHILQFTVTAQGGDREITEQTEKTEQTETNQKTFRLFRFFRLFRNLLCPLP